MRGWLSSLEIEFKQGNNRFHGAMQIWQALSVIAHKLTQDKVLSGSELCSAGWTLGHLN